MVIGTVVGNVWSTRRVGELPVGALLEVELDGSDERIVVFDPLGTGPGERVLITRGRAAADWFGDRSAPIDALLIGSIDAHAKQDRTPSRSGSRNDERTKE